MSCGRHVYHSFIRAVVRAYFDALVELNISILALSQSNYGVAPKDHDKTHFKRPVSPVEEHADDRAEGEDGDERFIQPFPTNESNTLSVAF
jgi:hypothetical protein